MFPLLIPLVTTLAPDLVNWLFGAKAEKTAAAVVDVVKTVTGADPTTTDGAAAVQAMLAGKPDIAIELQSRLLTLRAQMQAEADRAAEAQRAADLADLKAQLADVASARNQTVALAQSHSLIAWGAPVVSFIVLSTFGAMLGCVLTFPLPAGAEHIADIMLGTLGGMAVSVVAFWVGSSSGSRDKDVTISRSLAASQPPPGIAERRTFDQGPPSGMSDRRRS